MEGFDVCYTNCTYTSYMNALHTKVAYVITQLKVYPYTWHTFKVAYLGAQGVDIYK